MPSVPLERIHFIGNGAMDGALRALINMDERRLADNVAACVRHVELSDRADFQDTFLRCMLMDEK
jgi:uncharacterized 2Fe-2S/4Fe-4S cluster protein (DUF4445 family)